MLRRGFVAALGIVFASATGMTGATATTPTYRANDYGNVLNVLPAGQNGLATLTDIAAFEANGTRPAHSQDQMPLYANLLYHSTGLTDADLTKYYKDGSFGLNPADIAKTEVPAGSPAPVTIYRDKQYGVPHIYGDTIAGMAYGAGYAAAEDRLFLMDVLRHYGRGRLSEFLGPGCGNEQMDRDQLLLTGYTDADKQAQLDYIATLGPMGAEGRSSIHAFVQGINQYISDATTDPTKMPGEYPAVTKALPQPWLDTDIIDIASLVGGIFGRGGGNEMGSAALLQYLQKTLGTADGLQAWRDFHEVNDPDAPTTAVAPFPYESPGTIDPSTTAMPDDAAAPLTGGPAGTTTGCDIQSTITGLPNGLPIPHLMSNALLVDAKHTASGRPIAVFGPQVGYFAPQILMEVDLHAPDYDARGASFPGTNFLAELGRGQDYAWSATSADTDVVDQRLEQVCDPGGGAPAANGEAYMYLGACKPMDCHDDTETALTGAGGQGLPTTITHHICRTVHGVVQGWTTAAGKPVAVVNQRSTYMHELDSAEGFLCWQHPSCSHDAQSWMWGAQHIGYTFNWFYIDNQDIAYAVSGHDPIRPSNVDPNLPSWGTGVAEWQGFLSDDGHPHQVNSPTGFITSWNNKPAPLFSASDATYGFGPVFRVLSLNQQIQNQFTATSNSLSRANLVTAMETAASVDLSGARVLPDLLPYVGTSTDPGVQAMLDELNGWLASGAHRIRAQQGDSQYAHASAVAIMDELYPRLIEAVFNPIMKAGGTSQKNGLDNGYSRFPMGFADVPSGGVGSSYDGGWEGYMLKILRQLRVARGDAVVPPQQPFSAAVTTHVCGQGGMSSCTAAINAALAATYQAMVAANGNSTTVSSWTLNSALAARGTTMPAYDAIRYSGVGVIGQPNQDWQNRPTWQQVVDFPSHRPRTASAPAPAPSSIQQMPVTGTAMPLSAVLASLAAGLAVLGLVSTVAASALRRRAG